MQVIQSLQLVDNLWEVFRKFIRFDRGGTFSFLHQCDRVGTGDQGGPLGLGFQAGKDMCSCDFNFTIVSQCTCFMALNVIAIKRLIPIATKISSEQVQVQCTLPLIAEIKCLSQEFPVSLHPKSGVLNVPDVFELAI